MASAIALKLDYGALFGDGTGANPTGIAETGSIETSVANDPLGHADFRTAIGTLMTNNAKIENLSAIYSARTWQTMDSLVSGDQVPLTGDRTPESIRAIKHFVSNQVPDNLGVGNDESNIVVGDFSKLVVGMRLNIALQAFQAGYDGTTDAVVNYERWFRAVARFDVGVARANHFYVLTEVHD